MNKAKVNSIIRRNIIISVIAGLILIILFGIMLVRTFVFPLKYEDIVLENSYKFNLDPYLVFALINTESNFNKTATSIKDAKGLMQITNSTAEEVNQITNSTDNITDETIYDENINIELGCKYLSDLIVRYSGNYYLAICAYNAGFGNVDSWIDNEKISKTLNSINIELPFSETTRYLKKVISNYEIYKVLYPQLS